MKGIGALSQHIGCAYEGDLAALLIAMVSQRSVLSSRRLSSCSVAVETGRRDTKPNALQSLHMTGRRE